MSIEPDEPDGPDPEGPGPQGTLRPTGPGAVCAFLAIGLVGGWAVRPLSLQLGTMEPRISWLSVGIAWFLAAVLGGAAYSTWRARRDGVRLEPHRAVNRLVLGKACALVGAAIAGGYLGFALAHLGGTDAGRAQLWHSVLAGVGGIALVAASLLLEQACRVDDRQD